MRPTGLVPHILALYLIWLSHLLAYTGALWNSFKGEGICNKKLSLALIYISISENQHILFCINCVRGQAKQTTNNEQPSPWIYPNFLLTHCLARHCCYLWCTPYCKLFAKIFEWILPDLQNGGQTFSLPLCAFKMWYLNFVRLLWLQKDYITSHISVPWLEEANFQNEVAHAKRHSCKYQNQVEGGEERKASTVDLNILIAANILAGTHFLEYWCKQKEI